MLNIMILDDITLEKMSNELWYYCEGILIPNGQFIVATHGHVNTMIEFTGLESDVIYNMMPIDAAPLFWLVQYTNCVAVNYDFCIGSPNITQEQKDSLKKLVKYKIIKNNLSLLKKGQI